MTRDDIIRMAREAQLPYYFRTGEIFNVAQLERYAALVAAAEREKVAQWMMRRSYATGHGDTIEDLLQQLDWQILEGWNRALINGVKTEREQCEKLCADLWEEDGTAYDCCEAIRARGAS